MADDQVRGFGGRLVVDWETSFGVPRTAGAIRAIKVPFNSTDLKSGEAMTTPALVTDNRFDPAPVAGRKAAGGNVVVPVDHKTFGFWLRAALGKYSVVENVASNKRTGTPTCAITLESTINYITFSAAQTDAVTGMRVVYRNAAGVVRNCILGANGEGVDEDIKWVCYPAGSSGNTCVVEAGCTVDGIAENISTTPKPTVTISSGVLTFSTVQTGVVAGKVIRYDTYKIAIVQSVADGNYTVLNEYGVAPADASTKALDSIEAASTYTHTVSIGPRDRLPSFIVEKAILDDMTTPSYELYTGCKVESLNLEVGADGELTATVGIVASTMSRSGTAYSATVYDLYTQGDLFRHVDGSLFKEGGSSDATMETLGLTVTNNHDANRYGLAGGGSRCRFTEGKVSVSGKLAGAFTSAALTAVTGLLTKSEAHTESSLQLTLTSGTNSLDVTIPELTYDPFQPGIGGPAGIQLDLTWKAHYTNGTSGDIMTVTLINGFPSYSA